MNSAVGAPDLVARLSRLSIAWGNKFAPQIVAGFAVVGIAWQSAQLTWMLFSPDRVLTQAPKNAVSAQAPRMQQHDIDLQGIVDAHLFGLAQSEGSAADLNALPPTRINLVLAGTLALDDPTAGYAIVGENAAGAKFFRVGDSVTAGARLHSVYVDRVIIDRNGALETLAMPVGSLVTSVRVASGGQNQFVSNEQDALERAFQVQPVLSNGDLRGYRVYPGRDQQLFARLGLEPGDVVTLIDGNPLDQPDTGNALLSTLASSSATRITVMREGRSVELTLDAGRVSQADKAPRSTDSG